MNIIEKFSTIFGLSRRWRRNVSMMSLLWWYYWKIKELIPN